MIMTTELGGKKAGGGVKSIGDKLPQGLHTKQLQRELYPQAIVRTLRYYRVMKKENLFFSLFYSILRQKNQYYRARLPLVTHDLTSIVTQTTQIYCAVLAKIWDKNQRHDFCYKKRNLSATFFFFFIHFFMILAVLM